jgi:hypothetical protein
MALAAERPLGGQERSDVGADNTTQAFAPAVRFSSCSFNRSLKLSLV